MKILETIFFVLMIALPSLILVLALTHIKKLKKDSKFRKTIIKLFMLTLFINGIIWGALKMNNDKKEEPPKQNQNYKEPDDKNDNQALEPNEPNNNNNSTSKPQDPDTPNNSKTTSKGFTIETINGITYVDGYLIANKSYPLPSDYVPTNTTKPVTSANCPDCLDKETLNAYNQMKTDAAANGLTLWIASGYRSYSYQEALYNGYANRNGKTLADTYSARPGHSEHQTGFAFDLNSVDESFGSTKEGIWVNQNCYKYGFILRYPKGKDNETGYIYEPWHLRYVGVDLASKLYNAGDWITMENYFGITSQYSN